MEKRTTLVCHLLVIMDNHTIKTIYYTISLTFQDVVTMHIIIGIIVILMLFRTQPDRSATEPSLQRTTEEPWASCSCTTSQTRTPSVLFRIGKGNACMHLYPTCVSRHFNLAVMHVLLSGPHRLRRTRGITHRWYWWATSVTWKMKDSFQQRTVRDWLTNSVRGSTFYLLILIII